MTRRTAKGARRSAAALPQALARRAMGRFGRGARGRMATAAALRALSVLLRRHPRAAIDMAGAGVAAAGRVGLEEARTWLKPAKPPPREKSVARKLRPPKRLNSRDRRRLRKALAEDAARSARGDAPRG